MSEKFCPMCGVEVRLDARFCNMCGEMLVIEKSHSLEGERLVIVKAAFGKAVQLADELQSADGKVRKLVDDIHDLLEFALDGRDFAVMEVKGWTRGEVYDELIKCTIDGTSHFDRRTRVNRFFIRREDEEKARALINGAHGCAGPS